jgi:hypothetical protein
MLDRIAIFPTTAIFPILHLISCVQYNHRCKTKRTHSPAINYPWRWAAVYYIQQPLYNAIIILLKSVYHRCTHSLAVCVPLLARRRGPDHNSDAVYVPMLLLIAWLDFCNTRGSSPSPKIASSSGQCKVYTPVIMALHFAVRPLQFTYELI